MLGPDPDVLNIPKPMAQTTIRFEYLIEQFHNEIFTYLWRLFRKASQKDGAADVEDLTQEVFLRAYKNFDRLRPQSNHRAWLYKIATNCAYTKLNEMRKRSAAVRLDDPATDTSFESDLAPSPPLAEKTITRRVRVLMAKLPAKQKAAVVLRYLQDLDYAEIAEALRCSEESARANVYQAIRRLRFGLTGER